MKVIEYQDIRTFDVPSVRIAYREVGIVTTGGRLPQKPSKANRLALRKLDSYIILAHNWDGYNANPFSAEARELGRCAIYALDRAEKDIDDIAPGPSDELELAFREGDAEVRLFIDGEDWQWAVHRPGKATTFGSGTAVDTTDHIVEKMLGAIRGSLRRPA